MPTPRFNRRRRYPGKPSQPADRHVITDRCGPTGKARYRSYGAALEALERVISLGDPRHREQRAYPCDYCGGWHLTKQDAA